MLWTLPTLQKIGTFALVLIAFTALWLGGALTPTVAVICVALGVLGWFWEPPRIQFQHYESLWRPLTLAVLTLLILAALLDYLGPFDAAIGLVLYLTGAKLFQRERAADYLQALVLSFLLMAIATLFNEDISFGLLFVLYVLIGLICFTLYHLRIQTEKPEIESQAIRQTRLLDSRLLSTLIALACLALVFSVLFFFLFPRIGFGYLAQQSRSGPSISGFSEQVDLGKFGTQKSDPTVIMRVEFPEAVPEGVTDLYWRGISLDHYDGTTWTKTLTRTETLPLNSEGVLEVPDAYLFETARPVVQSRPDVLLHQSIYLEPLNTNTLFSVSPLIRIQIADRGSANRPQSAAQRRREQLLSLNQAGDITHQLPPQLSYQYDAFSLNLVWDPAVLRSLSEEEMVRHLSTDETAAYLQLPENLASRIPMLAEEITAEATTTYDQVSSIQQYLLDNYTYTVDLPVPGEDPLDNFLFEHQRGHCEYFSTAMAILLRSAGIPARSVNGFWGGKWNENDAYLAIRNADAHSWVEVPFGPYGWVRFDPTPSAANVSQQTSWMDPLRDFYDSLRFRWIKYVIQYDLQTQLSLLQELRNRLSQPDQSRSWRDWAQDQLPDLRSQLQRNWIPVAGVLTLTGAAAFAGEKRRYRSIRAQDLALVTALSGLSGGVVWLLWDPQAGNVLLITATVLPSLAFAWIRWHSFSLNSSRQAELQQISRIYLQLRQLLKQSQIDIDSHPGPEALITAINQSDLPEPEWAAQLIRRYMEVRFGQQPITLTELKSLQQQFKHLRRLWKEKLPLARSMQKGEIKPIHSR